VNPTPRNNLLLGLLLLASLQPLGTAAQESGTPPRSEPQAVAGTSPDEVREAEEALIAAVGRSEALGNDESSLAANLRNLAIFYQTRGRYAEARRLHERALSVRTRAFGRTNAPVAQSLDDLALLAVGEGRLRDAERLYERALRIQERLYGAGDIRTASDINNLALLHARQMRFAKATKLYLRELAILEQTYGASSIRLVSSLETLAGLHAARSQTADAEALYRRAIAIAEADDAPASERRLVELLDAYAALLRPLADRAADAFALAARADTLRATSPGADRRSARD
jgi:tetratricopeptide (TPR) repeat protein